MSTQIIIAAVTAAATCITVVVTLGLALLNGFRNIHNTISQNITELREANAAEIKDLREANAAEIKDLREANAAQFKDLREANAAQFKELRDDNKELRKDIAKNAVGIARIEGGMTVVNSLLESILQAILPSPVHTTANPPAGMTAHQMATSRDTRAVPVAVGSPTDL